MTDKYKRVKGECVLRSDYINTENDIQGNNVVASSAESNNVN